MKMNFKPAFRSELRNMLLGCAPFFGVIVVLVASVLVSAFRYNGNISFSAYAVPAAICLFVFGVVEPRPALRLCVQMGVSRRTALAGNLSAALVTGLVLSAGGEVLFALGKLVGGSKVMLMDLYQVIYVSGSMDDLLTSLTFPQHLMSMLFNLVLMMAFYCLGMFFTFLFWRLSKFWTVVTAVSIPLVLNLVPVAIYRSPLLSRCAAALFHFLAASVWNVLGFLAAAAVVLTVCNWLLVRRANIKAPVSK